MRGTSTYNDRFFRIAAAVVGAYFVTEFGGEDGYFSFRRLLSREFYIEYGSSLLIAVVLIELIARVTRILDRYYDWEENAIPRAALQCLFGIVLPAMLDFFMASVYFRIFGVNILDTTYLVYALPYIIAMITMFNLYYVIHYFYRMTVRAQKAVRVEENKRPGEFFIVSKGAESYSIAAEDIAYFYIYNRQTFLYTLEKAEFILNRSLESVEKKVSRVQFFRVNRHMIINFSTLRRFVSIDGGKLQLTLEPVPLHVDTILISQRKASRFKNWLER